MIRFLFLIITMIAIDYYALGRPPIDGNNSFLNYDFKTAQTGYSSDMDSIQFRTKILAHITLLNDSSDTVKQKQLSVILEQISSNRELLEQGFDILESRYYDRNSSHQNESYLKVISKHIINSLLFDDIEKVRYKYTLEIISKNSIGEQAADFKLSLPNNQTKTLHEIKAKHIILFFNSPDCEECIQTKHKMAKFFRENQDEFFKYDIKLLAVYPDNEIEQWTKTPYYKEWINGYDATMHIRKTQLYDLPFLPLFYLLDEKKIVVLKSADWSVVKQYLQNVLFGID